MLRKIDECLLDEIFQKLADWFQEKTGKNCFFLARLGLWGVLIMETVQSMFTYFTNHALPDFITVLFVICSVHLITREQKREEDWDETPKNTANPDRVDDCFIRLFAALFLVGLNALPVIVSVVGYSDLELPKDFFNLISGITLTSALYFSACTPKPPSRFHVPELVPVRSS